MRKWFLFIMFFPLSCFSQESKGGLHKLLLQVDSLLGHRYRNAKFDTLYLSRPSTRWTLKGRVNLSGAGITAKGKFDDASFSSELNSELKGTVSMAISYQGLTLGAAINPSALSGRYKDYELNLHFYGNRMGLDVVYQQANSFEGWTRDNAGNRYEVEQGSVKQHSLSIDGYYAFNHRRFSYAAAFTQSYIQRRSCGSWLLGVSIHGLDTKIYDVSEESGLDGNGTTDAPESSHLRFWRAGIGAGYGYNFVLPHNWLLHVSTLPTFVVYSNKRYWMNGEQDHFPYHFPELVISSHAAVVHSFGSYFLGGTLVFNYSNVGTESQLEIINTKWLLRAFVGFRF